MSAEQLTDIEVVQGPDRGMLFTLVSGFYRIIVQNDVSRSVTERLTAKTIHALTHNHQRIVDRFLQQLPEFMALKEKRRGPDIYLNDLSVAQCHAVVFAGLSSVILASFGEEAVTIVNGLVVSSAVLEDRDVVKMGSTTCVVHKVNRD